MQSVPVIPNATSLKIQIDLYNARITVVSAMDARGIAVSYWFLRDASSCLFEKQMEVG